MLTDVEIKHIFYFLDSDVCNKADKNREVLQTTSPAQEIMNFFLRSSYMPTAFQNLTKSTHVTLVRLQLWHCSQSSFEKTKGSWHSCLEHLALHLTLDQGFIWWHLTGLCQCQQSSSAELSQKPFQAAALPPSAQKHQSLTQQVQLTGFWMLFIALAK